MPGGIPVTSFSDFMRHTGPFIYTDPQEIVNDAMRQSTMFQWAFKGRKAADVVQGGSNIQDTIFLNDKATFEMYNPGDPGTPTQPQLNTNQVEHWRWSRDHMAYQDEIIELNTGLMSASARGKAYKDAKWALNQQFYTSLYNGCDAQFWKSPHGAANYAAMEGNTVVNGGLIKSFLAYISENNTTYAPLSWTNIHGIPANATNWTNQVTRYDFNDPNDLNQRSNGLFDAMQRMNVKLSWKKPGSPNDQYFTESDPKRCVIFCSPDGHSFYSKLAREANQILRKAAFDGGVEDPTFLGIPLQWHQDLGTVLNYLVNGTAYSEMDTTLSTGTWSYTNSSTHNYCKGYRYYFLDFNYLRVWWHSKFNFRMSGDMQHMNAPGTHVEWCRLGWNTFCRSRKRLGVVGPGASSTLTL